MDDLLFKNLSVLFTGALAYMGTEWVNRRKLKRARTKAIADLGASVDTDARVNTKLATLLYAVQADKAKVFRFHNGGIYYNEQAMKKFSMTSLQLRDGVMGPRAMALKDLNSALFPHMLKELIAHPTKVLEWTTENAPDDYLKVLHREEGVQRVLCVNLKDYKGQMLGFVSLNWINEKVPAAGEHDEIVLRFAVEIGDCLSKKQTD